MKTVVLFAVLTVSLAPAGPLAAAGAIDAAVDELAPEIIELRHRIHQNPDGKGP